MICQALAILRAQRRRKEAAWRKRAIRRAARRGKVVGVPRWALLPW